MDDILQKFENICDKNALQTYLSYMGLFIGLYEQMIDMVEERVESFLCNECRFENGNIRYVHNEEYKNLIKNRRVDELGNKNTLKAAMLWFQSVGAITEADYNNFLRLKKLRDSYVHKMSDHIWNGLEESEALTIFELLDLYSKIDKWWINEIEIPIDGRFVDGNYDRDGVQSFPLITFKMMLGTMYGEKSEEYMKMIRDIRNGADAT